MQVFAVDSLHFSNFVALLNKIGQIIQDATSAFSLKEYESIEHLPEVASLLALIASTPKCPTDWLLKDGISDILTRIQKVCQSYHTIDEKENEILSVYEKEILEINAAGMLRQFKSEYSSVFRIFNSNYVKDKNTLKGFAKNVGYKVKYQEAVKQLETIKQIHKLIADIVSDEATLKDWLGEHYNGRTTDWDYLFGAFKWIAEVKSLYGLENITISFAEKVCGNESSELAESLRQRLIEKQKDLSIELDFLCPLYDSTQYNITTENIQSVSSKFSEAYKSIDYLPDWIDFINARNVCAENGLLGFLDA